MLKHRFLLTVLLLSLTLGGCGTSSFERGVTGAAIGAGAGAGIGAAVGGNVVTGAAVGGLVGGLMGVATDKKDLNLDDGIGW